MGMTPDNLDLYDPNAPERYDNYTALRGEDSGWRREQLWHLLPLLLAVAAIALHSVATRVLWAVSVRCKFGQPTFPDLHQILLALSCACLLRLCVYIITTIRDVATSPTHYDYALCVICEILSTSSQVPLRLLVAFLALRVCLNRPIEYKYFSASCYINTSCSVPLFWLTYHGVNHIVLDIACGYHGISDVWSLGHISYTLLFNYLLMGVSLLLFVAALCAVGMRRWRKTTTGTVLQSSPAEAGPTAEGLVDGAGGENVEENGVGTELEGVEGGKPVTSPGRVTSLENFSLAISGVFFVSFVLEIVFDNFIVEDWPFAGAGGVIPNSLYVMLMGVAAALYFCMYPGYLGYVRRSCC